MKNIYPDFYISSTYRKAMPDSITVDQMKATVTKDEHGNVDLTIEQGDQKIILDTDQAVALMNHIYYVADPEGHDPHYNDG
jgi:hypothetical protein